MSVGIPLHGGVELVETKRVYLVGIHLMKAGTIALLPLDLRDTQY